jgi:hypothetical protein
LIFKLKQIERIKTMHKKTLELLNAAKEILEASGSPMTVRQCYYQLVTKHIINNSIASYNKISRILGEGRDEGIISWDLIEDRIRVPHFVSQWDNLADFFDTVKQSYKKNCWQNQDNYVEVTVEKDALSGIFADELQTYGVTLNVGRGYDSKSSLKKMADRFIEQSELEKNCILLSFGDFDPSGEDIFRALEEGLQKYGADEVDCKRCAILKEDIELYNLPPDIAKKTDRRYSSFIQKNDSVDTVELDALPINVLKNRIKTEIEACIDSEPFFNDKKAEQQELQKLQKISEKL